MAFKPPPSSPPTTTAATTNTTIAVPTSLARYQISPATFLEQHKDEVHHLVAAAVVARRNRILVLQRSRHDYAGLSWEVPGGSCEAGDETILSATCRELWEEAGLRAVGILDVVEDAHKWIDAGSVWRKMTFIAQLGEDGEVNGNGELVVKLDPDEHEDFAWVSEQEVVEDRCGERVFTWTSPEQKITILDAFKLLRLRDSNEGRETAPVAIGATQEIKH